MPLTIRHAWLWLAALGLSGCVGDPFGAPRLSPLPPEVSPAAVVRDYREALPTRFAADTSLILRRRWRDYAMLGYVQVDRAAETFELVCLSHLGIKLLHLAGDRAGSRVVFAVPALAESPELLAALAEDFRRIHFGLVPPDDAEVVPGPDTLRFRSVAADGGHLEHVFGGEGMHLLEKHGRQGWRQGWQVRFYDYGIDPGGLFPRGVVMDNRRLGYRLVVKTRDWQPIRAADPTPVTP